MTNSVNFQDQAFVPVGTSVGLAELDGEQLIRVVKLDVAFASHDFALMEQWKHVPRKGIAATPTPLTY